MKSLLRPSIFLVTVILISVASRVLAADEWWLLGAPVNPLGTPLSRWEKLGSFDSVESCEAALRSVREERLAYVNNVMLQGESPNPRQAMTLRALARAVQCVVANDPRLLRQ